MPILINTSGRHLQSVNGENVMDKKFGINIDSARNEDNQVMAVISDDGKKYAMQDSLQQFIKKMSNNDNSIFKLLKKEEQHSRNIPRLSVGVCKKNPPKLMDLKAQKEILEKNDPLVPLKKTGNKRSIMGKMKKGITEKIFHYNRNKKNGNLHGNKKVTMRKNRNEGRDKNNDKAKGKKGRNIRQLSNEGSRKKKKKKITRRKKLAIAKKLVEELSGYD